MHIQLYSDRTATSFNGRAFVICKVHVMLQNFTAELSGYVVYSHHTLISFTFLGYEDALTDMGSAELSSNFNSRPLGAEPRVIKLEDTVTKAAISTGLMRNYFSFAKWCIMCSNTCSSINMSNFSTFYSMGDDGIYSHSLGQIVVNFQNRKVCLELDLILWLSSCSFNH